MKRGTEKGIAEVNGRLVETSREYIERIVYDNNYNMVRKREYVGEVDFEELEEEEQPNYCKNCLNRGYRVPLGPKILMPNEQRQPDYDEWLECPTCYNVIPKFELEKEASIKDSVETVDSPFENQTEIIGLEKRNSKTMGKQSRKRNRPHHKDPEIDREIQQHGIDAVNIIYDSSGL